MCTSIGLSKVDGTYRPAPRMAKPGQDAKALAAPGGGGLTTHHILHWLQRGRPRKPSRTKGAQEAAAGEAQKSLKRKAQPALQLDKPGERPPREDACSAPGAPEQATQAASVDDRKKPRSAATPGRKRHRRSAAYWSYPVRSRPGLWACMACPLCFSLAHPGCEQGACLHMAGCACCATKKDICFCLQRVLLRPAARPCMRLDMLHARVHACR